MAEISKDFHQESKKYLPVLQNCKTEKEGGRDCYDVFVFELRSLNLCSKSRNLSVVLCLLRHCYFINRFGDYCIQRFPRLTCCDAFLEGRSKNWSRSVNFNFELDVWTITTINDD